MDQMKTATLLIVFMSYLSFEPFTLVYHSLFLSDDNICSLQSEDDNTMLNQEEILSYFSKDGAEFKLSHGIIDKS